MSPELMLVSPELMVSPELLERMRSLLSEPRNQDEVPAARQLTPRSLGKDLRRPSLSRRVGMGGTRRCQAIQMASRLFWDRAVLLRVAEF